MAIEFHCEHCGKMVRAGAEHAGKRGKCPSCHQPVYIPAPDEEIEPLRLAPIDPNAERDRQRLLKEGRDLATRLMKEKDAPPPEPAARPLSNEPVGDMRLPIDMDALIIDYVLAMADGSLDEAEEIAKDIRRDPKRAEEVMQRFTMDEIPPAQLAAIKRPVLIGFFKQLRERR